MSKTGYVSLSQVESYFQSFFTVVFDLSVSLQTHILPAASVTELARATAAKAFADSGVPANRNISFVQFREWCTKEEEQQQQQQLQNGSNVGASPGGRVILHDSEESEEEEEEEPQDSEDEQQRQQQEDEEDERFAAETAYWLQQRRMQQAAQGQQQSNGRAQNGRAKASASQHARGRS